MKKFYFFLLLSLAFLNQSFSGHLLGGTNLDGSNSQGLSEGTYQLFLQADGMQIIQKLIIQ